MAFRHNQLPNRVPSSSVSCSKNADPSPRKLRPREIRHLRRAFLGNAQLACGLKEDAKTSYLRAIELDPLFGDAHFNVGNIYFLNRQYAFAVECYEHCIQLKPADLEAHT